MTHSEAIKQLESWLLVPVNDDDAVRALATIQGTSDFNRYLKRVAEAAFKSPDEILQDVNAYQSSPHEENPDGISPDIAAKLEALSGKKRNPVQHEEGYDDVFNVVEKSQRDETQEEIKEARANARFEAFTQGYVGAKHRSSKPRQEIHSEASEESSALVCTCKECGHPMTQRETSSLTSAGILLTIVLAFICLPLIIFPLIYAREKKTEYYCPHCRH